MSYTIIRSSGGHASRSREDVEDARLDFAKSREVDRGLEELADHIGRLRQDLMEIEEALDESDLSLEVRAAYEADKIRIRGKLRKAEGWARHR